jgi:hypothetical protein
MCKFVNHASTISSLEGNYQFEKPCISIPCLLREFCKILLWYLGISVKFYRHLIYLHSSLISKPANQGAKRA